MYSKDAYLNPSPDPNFSANNALQAAFSSMLRTSLASSLTSTSSVPPPCCSSPPTPIAPLPSCIDTPPPRNLLHS